MTTKLEPLLRSGWPNDWRPAALPCLREAAQQARRSPNDLAGFCFTDPAGRRLQQSQLHRSLQEFLSGHRRALVELPRDHGKSMQVCIRILWELGHDPSLRVKIVCASHAMAVERCRFLREAIAHNPLVRLVFPDLRHAQPWGTTRFTIRRPANVIGPTLTAVGVGSVSTGSRAEPRLRALPASGGTAWGVERGEWSAERGEWRVERGARSAERKPRSARVSRPRRSARRPSVGRT